MNITHLSSEPAGFTSQSSFAMSNNHTATGRAFLDRDTLLFKFYSFDDDVQIDVYLTDDDGHSELAYAEIDVPRNGGDRFVLFDDFPVNPGGDKPRIGRYELKLTNQRRESASTRMDVRIYRKL